MSFPSFNFKEIQKETEFMNVCLAYLDIIEKLIPSNPRSVIKSDEFYCPVRCRSGLKKLEEAIEKGEDITPFLSRGVKKIRTVRKKGKVRVGNLDSLLNALNIHHLHLGDKIESDGFISRTGPILICIFTKDTAYFINTMRHGERKVGSRNRTPGQKEYYQPWYKQHIIETVNRNWPQLLEEKKIKITSNKTISDKDYSIWSKNNINVLITTSDASSYTTMKTLSGDNITSTLFQVMDNPLRIKHMKEMANVLAKPNAHNDIISIIKRLVKKPTYKVLKI